MSQRREVLEAWLREAKSELATTREKWRRAPTRMDKDELFQKGLGLHKRIEDIERMLKQLELFK